MKNNLTRFAAAILLLTFSIQLTFAQSPQNADAEKVRKKLVKILQGENNKVKVKLKNGESFAGNLTSVDVDSFTIYDSKTNAPRTTNLEDLEKVKKSSNLKTKDAWWVVGIGWAVLALIKHT
jgi:small nuclear ribonucleoprotein (snRNP)-like protein